MPQVGAMNVSTHNPIIAEPCRMESGEPLELLDVTQAGTDAQFEPLRERPVRTAESATHVVHLVVHAQGHAMQQVTEAAQPTRANHRCVELITV